MEISGVV